MVSRKVLEERGVFTCDMDELHQQFEELNGTLTMLVTHTNTALDAELMLALQGVTRSLLALERDVREIDDTLRDRGAIVDAHEYLRRRREYDDRERDAWQLEEEVQ